jgi:hypothetical protein
LFSILLFGAGGIIGFMISGSTVTVPAHYHGSIVGITIAFMGITYHLLPQLGFHKLNGRIVGLAWSGGYNVARKSTEVERGIEQTMGLGLMGFGGLVSIIGGVMFLVLVYLAMKPGAN